jgi:hypothetical protein
MACAPSDRSQAPSASMRLRRRTPVHRSSDHIGALAAPLARAQAELTNPLRAMRKVYAQAHELF